MEVWIRSCTAPAPMTCESGYTDYGESGEFWTLCCDTDNCNHYDPRDDFEQTTTTEPQETTTEESPEGLSCYFCASNNPLITEEQKIACETGVGLEETIKDCSGIWGNECLTTVFRNTGTGEEVWARDCVAPPPMTCDEGHGTIYQGWVYWRACCNESGCN